MPYLLFLKIQQNLNLSSAANYRWVKCLQDATFFSVFKGFQVLLTGFSQIIGSKIP